MWIWNSFRLISLQWHPTPVLLPGKSYGRRSLVGYSPWGRQESDLTRQLKNKVGTKKWMSCEYSVVSLLCIKQSFSVYWDDHVLCIIWSIKSAVYEWRRKWQPTAVLLPGKPHGQRSLVGCSPWGRYESDMTERLHFHFSLSCIGEGNGNPLW